MSAPIHRQVLRRRFGVVRYAANRVMTFVLAEV
jgi:hypothetical protein